MRVRPLCVQWNETDLHFVSRLMEQEGLYYYFEHTKDAHELVLVNDAAALSPCPVDDDIETHLNLERAQIHNDMIYKWQEVATLQPELVTLDDYDYEKPQTSLLKVEPVPQASQGTAPPPGRESKLEIYHWPGDYRQVSDGGNYARIRAQEFACRRARVWLETNARHLVPGHTFRAGNPFDRTNLDQDPGEERRYLLLGGQFSIVVETGMERHRDNPYFLFKRHDGGAAGHNAVSSGAENAATCDSGAADRTGGWCERTGHNHRPVWMREGAVLLGPRGPEGRKQLLLSARRAELGGPRLGRAGHASHRSGGGACNSSTATRTGRSSRVRSITPATCRHTTCRPKPPVRPSSRDRASVQPLTITSSGSRIWLGARRCTCAPSETSMVTSATT